MNKINDTQSMKKWKALEDESEDEIIDQDIEEIQQNNEDSEDY